MKKLLLIALLFSTLAQAQTYQDSLTIWNKTESLKSYGWFDSLSNDAKASYNNAFTSLRIKAAHEQYLNGIKDSLAAVQQSIIDANNYIIHLQSLGYKCDGSLDDWYIAYNHKEVFGQNWDDLATEQYNTNKDDELGALINFCKNHSY